MTRLLLDEMLSPAIAHQLRAVGADVEAIAETPGLRGTPDADVLELAASRARVLVTDNIQDFRRLEALWAAQGRTHSGILYFSTRTFPTSTRRMGQIAAALRVRHAAGDWPGTGQADFLRVVQTSGS